MIIDVVQHCLMHKMTCSCFILRNFRGVLDGQILLRCPFLRGIFVPSRFTEFGRHYIP